MVQSLGISIGNANSYVAAAGGGGIEILLNEFSNRSTPSMVAFTDKARSIGTEASSNFFMNMKNTIYDLIVLLGKRFSEVQPEKYPFKIEQGLNDQVLVVVRHLGEERKFTITQVLAMLMTKLRGVAGECQECVLSCPQFYTDDQKTALVQAALLAGMNPLQVISEMSAVILNYAYYRTTKQDTDKIIAFINFGQSNLQSVVAWLTPKEDVVRVLSAQSVPIGGQDFDRRLAEHFIKHHNLNLNQKSYLKLVSACTKVKCLLSANANEIPINVESLISDEKDFSARIDRATFEEMCQDLFKQAEDCLKETLSTAKVNFDIMMKDIAEAKRVAAKKAAAKKAEALKKAEAKKAEAKKAAEAKAAEAKASESKQTENNNGDPKQADDAKPEEDAEMKAAESQDNSAEVEMNEVLVDNKSSETKTTDGKTDGSGDTEMADSEPIPCELSVPFLLSSVEMVGGSIRIPAIKQIVKNTFNITPSTTLNTDEAVARGCVLHCATLHPGMKVKRQVRILNVEPFSKPIGMTCDKESRRIELELITQDRRYMSRIEARNSLEEYIYSERSKLKEGDQFLEVLSTELDWLLTDEGEEAPEEVYLTKLVELKHAAEKLRAETEPKQQPPKEAQQSEEQQQESGEAAPMEHSAQEAN